MKAIKAISLTLVSVLWFGLSAQAASVLQVSKKGSVAGSPEEVWKKIGGWCTIKDWHPAVAKCEESKEGEDTFRLLTLGDGGTIYEKLSGTTDTSYSYAILKGVLPVKEYNAVFTVRKNFEKEGESFIVWSASFQAKGKPDSEAKATMEGVFEAGIKAIQEKLKAN